jgi:hypothetical protein
MCAGDEGAEQSGTTYMDAISAIDVITNPIPMAVPRYTKIAPPVPPFVRGIARVLSVDQSMSVV